MNNPIFLRYWNLKTEESHTYFWNAKIKFFYFLQISSCEIHTFSSFFVNFSPFFNKFDWKRGKKKILRCRVTVFYPNFHKFQLRIMIFWADFAHKNWILTVNASFNSERRRWSRTSGPQQKQHEINFQQGNFWQFFRTAWSDLGTYKNTKSFLLKLTYHVTFASKNSIRKITSLK